MMHSNWRDCATWRDENLAMNTSSNEACKLYDVCLSQLVGFYNNKEMGGLGNSIMELGKADDDFIMGHCLRAGASLLGSSDSLNSASFKPYIQSLKEKCARLHSTLSRRETTHIKALELCYKGYLPEACSYWETILVEHPNDMLAAYLAHWGYFYMGYKYQMRDSIAKILPKWRPSTPLYGYLYGMYAFGLTQSGELDKAAINALRGLELNKNDIWSTHALAHVYEYRSEADKGVKFLLDTENDWSRCDLLSTHNYWHMGLYYLEKGEHEQVINIIDNQLMRSLDCHNAVSLMMRLRMDDIEHKIGIDYFDSRWSKLNEKFKTNIKEHGYMYSDFHLACILGYSANDEQKQVYFNTLNKFINTPDEESSLNEQADEELLKSLLKSNKHNIKNTLKRFNYEIANDLFQAIFHYFDDEYEKVVELIYPIRYELYKIGGSNAQRDLISLCLLHSALKSSTYKQLGEALLRERLANNPHSQMSHRIALNHNVLL
jgi:hypothetical protein